MAKRVLVVGLGNMGMSHALAYTRIPGFEVVGVCERRIADRKLPPELAKAKKFDNFEKALAELKPDVVSINTLPDTHADFAIKAMEAGADVFVEKPLADGVANAEKVVATAQRTKRKLVVGYILRQHPSWTKFIEIARQLGSPLVFRMNLNQQSNGETWAWHKRLDGQLSADRRLRRPLCRRDVPDDQGEADQGPRHRRQTHRRSAGQQLRHAPGRLRGRIGRMVRSGLGSDDERDRVLRQRRGRA